MADWLLPPVAMRWGVLVAQLAFCHSCFDWSIFAIDSEMMGSETSPETSNILRSYHFIIPAHRFQNWHPQHYSMKHCGTKIFSPYENQPIYGLNKFIKKSQMIRRESIANSTEIKRHEMVSFAANIASNLKCIHLRYKTLWRYFLLDRNELRVNVWSAFRRIPKLIELTSQLRISATNETAFYLN